MVEGDRVAVLDNQGHLLTVMLRLSPSGDRVMGEIRSIEAVESEPDTQVSLCFGLTKREKVELILQKGTEIGISSFRPFISSRTLVQTASFSAKKHERWERIIREAAEQSRRGLLPVLHPPVGFTDCLARAKQDHQLCLLAWEEAEAGGTEELGSLVKANAGGSIAVFVGPEGGFSGDEVDAAKQLNTQVISLGKRILRMETAAIVFPAIVMYALGEF